MMHCIYMKKLRWGVLVLILSLAVTAPAFSGFFGSVEHEKPSPEFSRDGDTITARLIPRAKSTSVRIHFKAENARLTRVTGMDFIEAATPDVDVKNFKSSLFNVQLDNLDSDGEATVLVSSDFFTSSTQFFIYNKTRRSAWSDSGAENISLANRVQEIKIRVKDGGPLDADGAADGKISVIGGPRDSFWGYALGTLFIRFFGIFLVLVVLMIGMILSGRLFKHMDSKHPFGGEPDDTPAPKADPTPQATAVSPETAASIGLAIHLSLTGGQRRITGLAVDQAVKESWTQSGRTQIMNERLMMYNRYQKKTTIRGMSQ